MLNKIFHTERFIGNNRKNFFEGWYFKHQGGSNSVAFIVGISTFEGDSHSFVQYIDEDVSYYFKFELSDFSFKKESMEIKIADNSFSLRGIDFKNEIIEAKISYSDFTMFKKSLLCPSSMGYLTYFKNGCSHILISLRHKTRGFVTVNNRTLLFDGFGYIEKDYGNSFPQNYYWTQGQNEQLSVVFAYAYPLIFNIKGFICVVHCDNKQHNLSFYTGARLKEFKENDDTIFTVIEKNKNCRLEIGIKNNEKSNRTLVAPNRNGNMNLKILESLCADMSGSFFCNGQSYDFDIPCAFEKNLVFNN